MSKVIESWKDINILIAVYEIDGYEGSAFVLFERDGKLYEVHGSHCSCYGLEGQFDPEETNLKALEYRLLNGRVEYASILKEFLGI